MADERTTLDKVTRVTSVVSQAVVIVTAIGSILAFAGGYAADFVNGYVESAVAERFDDPDTELGRQIDEKLSAIEDRARSELRAFASSFAGEFSEYYWQQGQGARRMIPAGDGVCFLTFVTGRFEGGGEQVRVNVNSEGYWILSGASAQAGVAARAMCWTFPTTPNDTE